MTTQPEDSAKSFTKLVATEIRVVMAQNRVQRARGDSAGIALQSELARAIGKTEQWLSVRMRGIQSFAIDDLPPIAKVLGVEVVDLFPTDFPTEPNRDDGEEVPATSPSEHRPNPPHPTNPQRPRPKPKARTRATSHDVLVA